MDEFAVAVNEAPAPVRPAMPQQFVGANVPEPRGRQSVGVETPGNTTHNSRYLQASNTGREPVLIGGCVGHGWPTSVDDSGVRVKPLDQREGGAAVLAHR